MTQPSAGGINDAAIWADSRLKQGKIVKIAGSDVDSAIGVMPLEGAFHRIPLYDRRTGDRVMVPRHDREYQLAKMRPADPRVKGGQYTRKWAGGRLVADIDMERIYSEIPLAETGRVERVAPAHGSKRNRRRGKRGRGGRR
jgi:hypothetical protein